ncbi:OprO/OprP family phosphate-selective porin [Allosphingosinicella sp.]|uniref:OprO/OprP family phosphate-selective porin n=1 Tax=Allosphingosinicella sp. TaxID=2823234 RepID=UPI002FC225D9
MKIKSLTAALLAASVLVPAAPAFAQDKADALAAEIAAMRAKVESLEAEMAALKAEKPAEESGTTISWKGAPLIEDKDSGWSFKPRGRLQYDVAHVGSPDGVEDRGLGFSNELRRARLGVEGTIPGGFDYKFELDFAEGDAEITDATLGYDAGGGFGVTVGQHNNFQSLEELTSSRFTSFMERAAFTDAFNFERRVGLSAGYENGPLIANVGVFTDNVHDLDDENNSIGGDARLVFAPKMGETQLHFGGSAHFRDNKDLAERGDTIRYRQRPMVHSTDTRFLATPELGVTEETSYGLEAAAIHGPFHAAGEVHWLNADTIDDGASPTFFGGYAEVGYYLTGEARGYKGGKFDRTKVLNPLSQGGMGAFQVNLRYDHLDLNDETIIGGKQQGYQASLVWIPEDHVRFLLNYGRMSYDDAAIPAVGGDRDYSIDVFGARAQVDF